MPLTNLRVEHARPPEKPYEVFDGRGLDLEVTSRGAHLSLDSG